MLLTSLTLFAWSWTPGLRRTQKRTSSTVSPQSANLIIGGTNSGQLVLWYNRHNTRTPVRRSPLSASMDTQSVYSARVVGTQNAQNLITVITDGKMCSWPLDMLAQLQHKQSKEVATILPTACLGGDGCLLSYHDMRTLQRSLETFYFGF